MIFRYLFALTDSTVHYFRPKLTIFNLRPDKEILGPSVETQKDIANLGQLSDDIGEMARKADAAYAIMENSKTIQIRPKAASDAPKAAKSHNQPKKMKKIPPKIESEDEGTLDDASWKIENEKLAYEIAQAQAVLAALKPNVKPGGSKKQKER
jgi:hypothetical protein